MLCRPFCLRDCVRGRRFFDCAFGCVQNDNRSDGEENGRDVNYEL